jgi:hypothetical protein
MATAGTPQYLPNFNNEAPGTSIETNIWGRACYSMPSSALGLGCNPSLLAEQEKHLMRLNLNFDDHAKDVFDYAKDLQNEDELQIVRRAEGQRRPLVSRASSNIWYQREWWTLKWTPMRASAAIQSRNPAYPEISAHIMRESELQAQAGFFVADQKNILVGFQTRYVRSEYLRDRFDLYDALADTERVQIQKTKAVFFEPSVTYKFENSWNSQISAMISNVEAYRGGDALNTQNILDIGFSTTPEFWSKRITNTLHYSTRTEVDRVFDRLIMATNVEFSEKFSAHVGVGALSQGVGITGRLDSVALGLGYKSEDVAPESWKTNRLSQILFELGLAF